MTNKEKKDVLCRKSGEYFHINTERNCLNPGKLFY